MAKDRPRVRQGRRGAQGGLTHAEAAPRRGRETGPQALFDEELLRAFQDT